MELIVFRNHILVHSFNRQYNSQLLQWSLDDYSGGIFDCTKVLIGEVFNLRLEVAIVVIHILLIREQIVTMEIDDAHGRQLLRVGLATADAQNVTWHHEKML